MRRITRVLWITLALIFLFETWLWSHLSPIVQWIVDRIALRELKTRVASWVEHLPPYPTLLVFLVPIALLFPIKLLGLWMLARGSWLGAMAVLALAKVVSMGLTAFIFEITKPKLLQLPWFARFYTRVLGWIAWAHGLADPVKESVRAWFRREFVPLRRRLRSWRWRLGPKRAGRFMRRLMRLRRRMQQTKVAPQA
jgi:hypothetical protein